MQSGTLVTPKFGFTDCQLQAAEVGRDMQFVPFTPDKNTVCTVSEVSVGVNGKICIKLKEVRCIVDGIEVPFTAEYWDNIEATDNQTQTDTSFKTNP